MDSECKAAFFFGGIKNTNLKIDCYCEGKTMLKEKNKTKLDDIFNRNK